MLGMRQELTSSGVADVKHKHLVIVGASAMGRETCAYAEDCGWEVKGFLDSRKDVLDGFVGYPPLLGSVEDYEVQSDDVFVVAVGDPAAKMRYVRRVEELASARVRGGVFASIVHPTAYVGRNVRIGTGCIVCPHACITNDTVVGDHVIVNSGASINHDNRIGDGATICPGCHLAGRVTIGAGAFVGVGVTVIADISVGPNVLVGAGAVVVESFDEGRIRGVPARRFD